MVCLAPGDVGVFYDSEGDVAPLPLASVTRVEVTLVAEEVPGAVPHPRMPTVSITGSSAYPPGSIDSGTWMLDGTLTATGDMELATVDVFLRDPVTGFYSQRTGGSSSENLFTGDILDLGDLDLTYDSETPHTDFTYFVKWIGP